MSVLMMYLAKNVCWQKERLKQRRLDRNLRVLQHSDDGVWRLFTYELRDSSLASRRSGLRIGWSALLAGTSRLTSDEWLADCCVILL